MGTGLCVKVPSAVFLSRKYRFFSALTKTCTFATAMARSFNIQDKTKGYFLALVSTLAMANVYIFSKAALNDVHLFQFGFYWYGMALIWLILYLLVNKKARSSLSIPRSYLMKLSLIGILELAGTVFFFIAIKTMENPAMVSFLANMTPLLITLLGILFLQERYKHIEILGIILTIGGAFMISYQKPGSGTGWLRKGTEWVFLSSLIYSVAFILAKKYITKLNPLILTINRVVFLGIFMLLALIVSGMSFLIPGPALRNIALGSFLGPFLTALAQYSAIKYLEASRTSIITSSKGFFVLLGALFYFHLVPTVWQIWGGVLTVTGVILITLGKQWVNKLLTSYGKQ